MMKVFNIVGARPQIIKAAAISRAIRNHFQESIEEILIHTGQHYDHGLSNVFFDELGMKHPMYNLKVGSGSHAGQTAKIMTGLEELLEKEKPDVVIVYGGTNSTMAAAIVASKMHYPLVHVEAGLRSYNKSMPEEINRITTDHVSTLLFSPTITGFKNLINEGFHPENSPVYTIDNPKIYHSGDIMYDNALFYGDLVKKKNGLLERYGVEPEEFVLATIHRPENTDDPAKLKELFSCLMKISEEKQHSVVLPLHPRTKISLEKSLSGGFLKNLKNNTRFHIIQPVSFLEFILLEKNAKMILTDSGGVQKEAHFFEKPSIVFREETEWTELVNNGTSLLADSDTDEILKAYERFANGNTFRFPKFYGDGKTADFICTELLNNFQS
jgi:UDP-GlcNAc3NAcA epimerase